MKPPSDLQDACSLIHSAFVAGLGGDLDHAVEHHGHAADLAQALLERSLQHEKVRMAQGHGVPQIQPVAGLQVDLASHVSASAQQKRPHVERAVVRGGPPAAQARAAPTQMEDARRPVIDSIVGRTLPAMRILPLGEALPASAPVFHASYSKFRGD